MFLQLVKIRAPLFKPKTDKCSKLRRNETGPNDYHQSTYTKEKKSTIIVPGYMYMTTVMQEEILFGNWSDHGSFKS